jgi:hypothetical protein
MKGRYEYRGERYGVSELAAIAREQLGERAPNLSGLRSRLERYGWDVRRAVETPANPKRQRRAVREAGRAVPEPASVIDRFLRGVA